MNIVFFGTSNVALPILEELNKNHKVLAAVTTPDVKAGRSQKLQESPVSALAKDLQLPTFKPDSLKNDPGFVEQLKNLNADIFVIVAYGKILPLEIINLPPLKAVNVHFAALPLYRGPSPIQFALLNGDRQTGTSIFILDENIDDGPLLAQEIINIEPSDTYFTLADKLAKLSAKIITPTLEGYQNGQIIPVPQDEARATYSKIITKADGKINWEKTAQEIYNQFRAFYLWPGVWTTWQNNNLKITDLSPVDYPVNKDAKPGSILDQGVIVCGNQTALQIRRLQLAGKNETSIIEFLNGYQQFNGSQLE